MIQIRVHSELLARPSVWSDGALELRLRGLRVLADADTGLEGVASSMDALLHRVRVGDCCDIDGLVGASGVIHASRVVIRRRCWGLPGQGAGIAGRA